MNHIIADLQQPHAAPRLHSTNLPITTTGLAHRNDGTVQKRCFWIYFFLTFEVSRLSKLPKISLIKAAYVPNVFEVVPFFRYFLMLHECLFHAHDPWECSPDSAYVQCYNVLETRVPGEVYSTLCWQLIRYGLEKPEIQEI